MADDPWENIEPERANIAKAIFAAAQQIADEDGDGEFDLSDMPPGLRAIGGGFNRLVHKAAEGSLDENNPEDIVDALRIASATLVDQRQPPQYQGFKWLTGDQPLVDPKRFQFGQPSEAPIEGWEATVEKLPGQAPPNVETPMTMQELFDKQYRRRMHGPARSGKMPSFVPM